MATSTNNIPIPQPSRDRLSANGFVRKEEAKTFRLNGKSTKNECGIKGGLA